MLLPVLCRGVLPARRLRASAFSRGLLRYLPTPVLSIFLRLRYRMLRCLPTPLLSHTLLSAYAPAMPCPRMVLRDGAYGATRMMCSTDKVHMVLRVRYAMPGTESAYGAIHRPAQP
eukprot:2623796-Rhodomonas_salina.1